MRKKICKKKIRGMASACWIAKARIHTHTHTHTHTLVLFNSYWFITSNAVRRTRLGVTSHVHSCFVGKFSLTASRIFLLSMNIFNFMDFLNFFPCLCNCIFNLLRFSREKLRCIFWASVA